jgi:hypothetical protein
MFLQSQLSKMYDFLPLQLFSTSTLAVIFRDDLSVGFSMAPRCPLAVVLTISEITARAWVELLSVCPILIGDEICFPSENSPFFLVDSYQAIEIRSFTVVYIVLGSLCPSVPVLVVLSASVSNLPFPHGPAFPCDRRAPDWQSTPASHCESGGWTALGPGLSRLRLQSAQVAFASNHIHIKPYLGHAPFEPDLILVFSPSAFASFYLQSSNFSAFPFGALKFFVIVGFATLKFSALSRLTPFAPQPLPLLATSIAFPRSTSLQRTSPCSSLRDYRGSTSSGYGIV